MPLSSIFRLVEFGSGEKFEMYLFFQNMGTKMNDTTLVSLLTVISLGIIILHILVARLLGQLDSSGVMVGLSVYEPDVLGY